MKYTTVIYAYSDQKAFDAEWKRIHPLFLADEAPLRVMAVSADHEMDRVALIEEAIERYDDAFECRDVVRDILACGNVSEWTWPE